MLLYLDQNKLIELRENIDLRTRLIASTNVSNAALAVSFSHIIETAKNLTDRSREGIVQVVESFPNIQLNPLWFLWQTEIGNEFYRFLNLNDRIKEVVPFGPTLGTFLSVDCRFGDAVAVIQKDCINDLAPKLNHMLVEFLGVLV